MLLSQSIEVLYAEFRRYGLRRFVDHCACCHSPDEVARLSSAPLRLLSVDALGCLPMCGLFGGRRDVKHFLPRILELVAHDGFSPFDAPRVFAKLAAQAWRAWRRDEQLAVEAFLQAWWLERVLRPDVHNAITALVAARERLEPYMDAWVALPGPVPAHRLAQHIIRRRGDVRGLHAPAAAERLEGEFFAATSPEGQAELSLALDVLQCQA